MIHGNTNINKICTGSYQSFRVSKLSKMFKIFKWEYRNIKDKYPSSYLSKVKAKKDNGRWKYTARVLNLKYGIDYQITYFLRQENIPYKVI